LMGGAMPSRGQDSQEPKVHSHPAVRSSAPKFRD
jgi:hypothetical protein